MVVSLNKILKVLKGFAIIVACSFLVMTFMANDRTIGERIAYALFGCFILAFAYVSSFRNLLFAIFFFLLGITGVTLVFDDGSFIWSGALLELAFICAFIHFFRKAFSNIHFRRKYHINMDQIDDMTGLEFEHFTADLLSRLGYYRISVTKASGDQGIDVIAHKDGLSYAIQCKHYLGTLGNSAVQEAYAGKTYYGCFYAVVCTNSYFTAGAKDLAASTGVLLWDRSVLQKMLLQSSGSHFSPASTNTQIEPAEDIYIETISETSYGNTIRASSEVLLDGSASIHSNKHSAKVKQETHVNDDFIAEAQWYAARGGVDLTEDD